MTADPADTMIAPPGWEQVPGFDNGWLLAGGRHAPFLSYVDDQTPVNWSEDLEQLHEESSRTHFLDQWTRAAITSRIGAVAAGRLVVDLGCSTGFLLEDLSAELPDAVLAGVDMVPAGLVKAHSAIPRAWLVHADVCSLPFRSASVQVVVSANLLEHVADDRRALSEIERILAPGGRALLIVPAGPSTYDYYDRFLGHVRRYARHELPRKGRDAGLDVLESSHIASLIYPAFWLVKQRNRVLYDSLAGEALERHVTSAIAATKDSRLGRLTWHAEDWMIRRGVRLPFGIRQLVVFGKGR